MIARVLVACELVEQMLTVGYSLEGKREVTAGLPSTARLIYAHISSDGREVELLFYLGGAIARTIVDQPIEITYTRDRQPVEEVPS